MKSFTKQTIFQTILSHFQRWLKIRAETINCLVIVFYIFYVIYYFLTPTSLKAEYYSCVSLLIIIKNHKKASYSTTQLHTFHCLYYFGESHVFLGRMTQSEIISLAPSVDVASRAES